MAPSSRSRTKRSNTMRAYRPPFWRDVMFWIATGLSLLVGVLIVVALLGVFGQQGLIGDAASFLRDAGAPADTVAR